VIFGEGMINDAVSIILFQCVSMVYREVHDERDAFQIG
jgi:NhaP-type Na+/H+ or K+/H+ antiporter